MATAALVAATTLGAFAVAAKWREDQYDHAQQQQRPRSDVFVGAVPTGGGASPVRVADAVVSVTNGKAASATRPAAATATPTTTPLKTMATTTPTTTTAVTANQPLASPLPSQSSKKAPSSSASWTADVVQSVRPPLLRPLQPSVGGDTVAANVVRIGGDTLPTDPPRVPALSEACRQQSYAVSLLRNDFYTTASSPVVPAVIATPPAVAQPGTLGTAATVAASAAATTPLDAAMSQLPPHLRQYVDPSYQPPARASTAPLPPPAPLQPKPEYDLRRTDDSCHVVGATARGGALAWSDERRAVDDRYEYIDPAPALKLTRTFGNDDGVRVEGNTVHHPTGRAARSYPVNGREADSFLRRMTGHDPHRKVRAPVMNPTLFPEVEQHVAFEGQQFMSDRERDMAAALNPDTIGDYMLPFVRPDIRQWTERPVSYKKPSQPVREAILPDSRAGVHYQANNIGARVGGDEAMPVPATARARGANGVVGDGDRDIGGILPGDHHTLAVDLRMPRDKTARSALRVPVTSEPARTVVPDEEIPVPKELAPATYTIIKTQNKKLQQPHSLAYGSTYAGGQDGEDGAGMDLPPAFTTISLADDRRPHAHRIPITAGSATAEPHGAAPAPEDTGADRAASVSVGGPTDLRRMANGGAPLRKEARATLAPERLGAGVHVGTRDDGGDGEGAFDGVTVSVGRARTVDTTVARQGGGGEGREQRMTEAAFVQLRDARGVSATRGDEGGDGDDGVAVPAASLSVAARAEARAETAARREVQSRADQRLQQNELDEHVGALCDRIGLSVAPTEQVQRGEAREHRNYARHAMLERERIGRVGDALDDGTGTSGGDHIRGAAGAGDAPTVGARRAVVAAQREQRGAEASAQASQRTVVDEHYEDSARTQPGGANPMSLPQDTYRGVERRAQRQQRATEVGQAGAWHPGRALDEDTMHVDSHVLADVTSTRAHRTAERQRGDAREVRARTSDAVLTRLDFDEDRVLDGGEARRATLGTGGDADERRERRAARAEHAQHTASVERQRRATYTGLVPDEDEPAHAADRHVACVPVRAEVRAPALAHREAASQKTNYASSGAFASDEVVGESDTGLLEASGSNRVSVRDEQRATREKQRVQVRLANPRVGTTLGDTDGDHVEGTLGARGEHVGAVSRTALKYGGDEAPTRRDRTVRDQMHQNAETMRRGVHVGGSLDGGDGEDAYATGLLDGRAPTGQVSRAALAGRIERREQQAAASDAAAGRFAADSVGRAAADDEDPYLAHVSASGIGREMRAERREDRARRRLDVRDYAAGAGGVTIGDTGGDEAGGHGLGDRAHTEMPSVSRASMRELYHGTGARRETMRSQAEMQRTFTGMASNSDDGQGGFAIDASHLAEQALTTAAHRPDRAGYEQSRITTRFSNAEGDFLSAAVFEGPDACGIRDARTRRYDAREQRTSLNVGRMDDLHTHMSGHVDPHTVSSDAHKPIAQAKREQRTLALRERMRSESPPPANVLATHPRFRAMSAGGVYNINHAGGHPSASAASAASLARPGTPPGSPRRPASPIFHNTRVMPVV